MIKNVTIFGGARPKPGEPAYQEAYQLGALLAQAGFAVITGGYIGTMEAASRGAAENGGHVIGVTCSEIEAWRPVQFNQWVAEERKYATLRDRLMALIEAGDAAVVLPGGPGTLAEMSMMWNHLLVNSISPRLLVLLGSGWKRIMDEFFDQFGGYVPAEQRSWLHFEPNPEAAVNLIIHYRDDQNQ